MNERRDKADRYFDSVRTTRWPLLVELEWRIRRPIVFSIDREYRVTQYVLKRAAFTCNAAATEWLEPDEASRKKRRRTYVEARDRARRMIAEAIAAHLRAENLAEHLKKVGDWPDIPALVRPAGIPTPANWLRARREPVRDRYLAELMGRLFGEEEARWCRNRIANDKNGYLLNFGIRLWNDDVLAPELLLIAAGKKTRVMRAAALRRMSEKPREIAGEAWPLEQWRRFAKALHQRARGRRSPETSAAP